jgi:pyruvate/2-oxoglutarate dehydrogenase complex dihydrolipoamide acyltransferase (E2) component
VAKEDKSIPQKTAEDPKSAEISSKPKEPAQAPKSAPETDRIFASPLARKVASEKGISLQDIQGSGPSGRIVYADVETSSRTTTAPRKPSTMQAPVADTYSEMPLSNMRKVCNNMTLVYVAFLYKLMFARRSLPVGFWNPNKLSRITISALIFVLITYLG